MKKLFILLLIVMPGCYDFEVQPSKEVYEYKKPLVDSVSVPEVQVDTTFRKCGV